MKWTMIHIGHGYKTLAEVVAAGKKEYESKGGRIATKMQVHSTLIGEDEKVIDGIQVKAGLVSYPAVVRVQ